MNPPFLKYVQSKNAHLETNFLIMSYKWTTRLDWPYGSHLRILLHNLKQPSTLSRLGVLEKSDKQMPERS